MSVHTDDLTRGRNDGNKSEKINCSVEEKLLKKDFGVKLLFFFVQFNLV